MPSLDIDRVRIRDITVEELIGGGFLDYLRKVLGEDVKLVAALVITEKGEPLMIAHESSLDYEARVVKITLPPRNSEKYLEAIKKALSLMKKSSTETKEAHRA